MPRIEARISPDALNMVKRAAELRGCSIGEFEEQQRFVDLLMRRAIPESKTIRSDP
jgi:uncharacterized protein (DUF1778 family)